MKMKEGGTRHPRILTGEKRRNVCVFPKFICGNLIPHVIEFGYGAFGR